MFITLITGHHPGVNKLVERLNKIKSQDQWENCLHTVDNHILLRKKDGVKRKVQPTTIARRPVGVTRGS